MIAGTTIALVTSSKEVVHFCGICNSSSYHRGVEATHLKKCTLVKTSSDSDLFFPDCSHSQATLGFQSMELCRAPVKGMMYVCIFVYVYVYICRYGYIDRYEYIFVRRYIYIYVHISVDVCKRIVYTRTPSM